MGKTSSCPSAARSEALALCCCARAAASPVLACWRSCTVPVGGAVELDERAGLPHLPDHDVVMLARQADAADDPGSLALQVILRSIFSELAARHRPSKVSSEPPR